MSDTITPEQIAWATKNIKEGYQDLLDVRVKMARLGVLGGGVETGIRNGLKELLMALMALDPKEAVKFVFETSAAHKAELDNAMVEAVAEAGVAGLSGFLANEAARTQDN